MLKVLGLINAFNRVEVELLWGRLTLKVWTLSLLNFRPAFPYESSWNFAFVQIYISTKAAQFPQIYLAFQCALFIKAHDAFTVAFYNWIYHSEYESIERDPEIESAGSALSPTFTLPFDSE